MTDKDIKTGLRYCFSIGYSNCKGCPYFNTQKGKRCANALYDDVIDLINSQQKEIENLKFIQATKLLERFMTETVHQQQVIKEFVEELKKITVPIMIGNQCRKVISEQGIDAVAKRMGVDK